MSGVNSVIKLLDKKKLERFQHRFLIPVTLKTL